MAATECANPSLHRANRLLAGSAFAVKPIRHMSQRQSRQCATSVESWFHPERRTSFAVHDSYRSSALSSQWIAFFFDYLVARAAFASIIIERSFLSHVTCEAWRVIAEAGGIAHQKSPGIFEQGLKRIRDSSRPSCHANTPPCATAERGKPVVVHKPVHQVHSVASCPLIRECRWRNSRYKRNSQ